MNVRVRFSPSPTSFLRLDGLRIALFNYLFARHNNGTFVLRIEDIDQSRNVEDVEADIIRSLEWAGLTIDEGPNAPGEVGPYRQSERKAIYHKYAKQLIENGHAYYAFDTTEEIDEMRERLKASGNPFPKYDSITRQRMKNSLTLPKDEVERRLEAREEYVVRLKVPRRETVTFEDLIHGIISFDTAGFDDQVLLKSDGMPSQLLAQVVDDHAMNITHVIRGEIWLNFAQKEIVLYKAFGWEAPTMAHLPLIMSPSGRNFNPAESEGIPVNTKDYISGNYEPKALINFLAYLGWSPGDDSEIHDMKELCELFTLDRVRKSEAVFNRHKLMWYNKHYIRETSTEELQPRVKALAEKAGFDTKADAYLSTVLGLLHERVSKVDEFVEMGSFFFEAPKEYDEKAMKKWKADSPDMLKAFEEKVAALSDEEFKAANLKAALNAVVAEQEVGFSKVIPPVCIATTGQGFVPYLFPTLELLGKDEVLARIETTLERLA